MILQEYNHIFLKQEKDLEPYSRDIKDTLEKKKHILSKEEENLISNYSEIFGNSENTYDIFTNTELKYGILIDEEGKEVELTDANYTKFLKSKNENVRKQAFNLMYNGYKKYSHQKIFHTIILTTITVITIVIIIYIVLH